MRIYLFIFFITQVVFAFYIGKPYVFPSEYVYATHGDGGIIYYNMIYHTLYGNGFLLENMNYPRFESIFMTDAQASLAIVFSWLGDWMTPEKVVGWMHRFHYVMFGLASIYIFKIFEMLKVKQWLAIIGAILIIFLSPLTFRLQAGHFGLFYPFVFAYTTYYVVKIFIESERKWWDISKIAFVLVFFGLNNIYLVAINAAFLLLMTLGTLVIRPLRKKWWTLFLPAFLGLLIVFCFIHWTDIGSDRIEIQWGYDYNRTTLAGIFFPPTSLLYKILSPIIPLPIAQGESWMNLGLSGLIVLLMTPFLIIRKKIKLNGRFLRLCQSFLITGVILLIYSTAILYDIKPLREGVFHQFGFVSMFKASGRFSVPVYFMISILVVYMLNLLLEVKNGKVITVLLILIWCLETNIFLNHHAFGKVFENPFTTSALKEISGQLQEANGYQALYTLPVMEAWNDKFHMDAHPASAFESRMISIATGLPMINATLSRIGLTDGERAIQMASNPHIEKEMPEHLKSDKPILLVVSKHFNNYSIGEQYLLEVSELIFESSAYEWRRLDIDNINNRDLLNQMASEVQAAGDRIYTKDSTFFAVEHFDDMIAEFYFSAPGALQVDEENTIYEVALPDTISGGHEISLLCRVSPKLFGNPSFSVKTTGESDAEIVLKRSISKDNYLDWVRVWGWMDIPKGSTKLSISISAVNQTYFIDDICIKNWESTLIDGKHGFYNNFRVRR